MIQRRVRIEGRVQGVWFRRSTQRAAEQHQVLGWVQNNEDGSVEAVLQGAPDAVESVLKFMRNGPELARVDVCEVKEEILEEAFSNFVIR